MNKVGAFIFLALVATSSFAASEAANQYSYGMDLDIAQVVSIDSDPHACGVAPATMVYVDSQGQTHEMKYQTVGDCNSTQ